MKKILDISPATYKRHMIHGENRAWVETNCYTDVIVELVHAYGFEPLATMAFTLGCDFEGDQWTFFKFRSDEIREFYGFDLQELNPWRSLVEHIDEQTARGCPVIVELDSYFLPDTAGTAYKLAHVKSTIAVNKIDIKNQLLGYFHNQSYHELSGQDFADIFQTKGLVHDRMLPPYIEYVKRYPRNFAQKELVAMSVRSLKRHMEYFPKKNPFPVFKVRFEKDLEWLLKDSIELFHAYSFATLRQYGACFELAETYVQWLSQNGQPGLEKAVESFRQISQTAKSFQFQLARAQARKKPLDLAPLDAMAASWEAAMGEIKRLYS